MRNDLAHATSSEPRGFPTTMANQNHTPGELPAGHVRLPVVLTGSMGLALAGGLHALGLLEILDRYLVGLVSDDADALTPAVSATALWIATASVAYGLALVILEVPGNWRRITLWISTMAVIAGWLPVAAIAHTHVAVAAPLVAAAWAGLCSIIYAARHHMGADEPVEPQPPASAEEPAATDSSDATD